MLYDEKKVIVDIKNLPLDIRHHLSHVLRNGLLLIRASIKQDNDELKKLERIIEEMNL